MHQDHGKRGSRAFTPSWLTIFKGGGYAFG
jgi:hypothetical protein